MAFRTALFLVAFWIFAVSAAAEDAANLSVSLKPEKESYSLEEARSGNVTLTATFTNNGDNRIFLAHPSATAPEGFAKDGFFSIDERHGKSEILLCISGPGGEVTVIRNNSLRGFEPGNRFGLSIAPGASEEIRLGWLGPYFDLGMWDDLTEPIFDERGDYRIRMVYRNFFKKAVRFGEGGDIFEKDTPWTGEVESNETSVTVE